MTAKLLLCNWSTSVLTTS